MSPFPNLVKNFLKVFVESVVFPIYFVKLLNHIYLVFNYIT